MSEKKISVIIPCYNVEKYIDRCFESLKKQTLGMDQMELIFVNDASTDGTLSRLREYEQQYPEDIMLIPLEENSGLSAVRNIALQYASCPYIGYVDSDDMVEPEMFATLVARMEEYDCDFVECDWDFFSAESEEFRSAGFENSMDGYIDFSNYERKVKYIAEQVFFTSVCTKVYKRSFLLENNLFFPEGLCYEDIYFCYLCFLYADSYYHIEKPYYHYYLNPNGIVQQRTAPHQFDRMDVSLLFLEACYQRGLMERYKDIVEWMFLEKYYIYMIWDIWDVFPEKAYSYYQQMKQTILELVPDYQSNPFRKLEGNQLDDVILRLIDYPLEKEQFEELMGKLWRQQKEKK